MRPARKRPHPEAQGGRKLRYDMNVNVCVSLVISVLAIFLVNSDRKHILCVRYYSSRSIRSAVRSGMIGVW